MNRLKALVRLEIQNLMATMNVVSTRTSKNHHWGLLAGLLPAGIIIYLFATYSLAIFSTLPKEYSSVGLLMLLVLLFFVLLYLCGYSAYGHLFGFKDYDFLMSLPLDEKEIFLSKTLSFILVNYFYTFCAFISIFGVYIVVYQEGLLTLLHSILLFLAFPFIPFIIACIFAFVISMVGNRSKHKGVLKIVATVVAVIVMVAGINYMNFALLGTNMDLAATYNNFKQYVPFIYYGVMALAESNFVMQLLALVIQTGIFATFIVFFSKYFIKMNRILMIGYKRKDYRYQKQLSSSVFIALLKREWSRYLSNTTYVINTAFGPLMSVIGVGYLLLERSTVQTILDSFPRMDMFAFIAAMFLFTTGLVSTTYSSISLEGKQLWILKSLPLTTADIFTAKIVLNMLVIFPLSAISATLCVFLMGFGVMEWILLIVIIFANTLFSSLLGLATNLCFPKLDWEREIYVVKNSMAVFVMTLIEMVWMAICAFIGYQLFGTDKMMIFICGATLMLMGFNGFLYYWLKQKGTQKFMRLA